jgi:hypothetical protein
VLAIFDLTITLPHFNRYSRLLLHIPEEDNEDSSRPPPPPPPHAQIFYSSNDQRLISVSEYISNAHGARNVFIIKGYRQRKGGDRGGDVYELLYRTVHGTSWGAGIEHQPLRLYREYKRDASEIARAAGMRIRGGLSTAYLESRRLENILPRLV